MIKFVLLIARKPGLSKQEFIDYYETRHAPLAWKILPGIATYRRNYVGAVEHSGEKAPPLDFDVITELTFTSQTDYHAFKAVSESPAIRKQLTEDALKLLDPSKTRRFLVEERG